MRSGARSSVTDTAERLRLYARQFEDLHAPQNVTIAMREAANEIEHLRLALEVAANDLDDWGAYTKANNARAALEGE